jgi:Holliday junction resolvase RusA-like endonuclease
MLDTSDRPFALPPDVILDIPVPPSVNRTRRVDYAAAREVEDWKEAADMLLMASGQYRAAKRPRPLDRFELSIILDEQKCALDPDNIIKAAVDYLRRIELIKNDDKRYFRRLTVEWGAAPEGCRLVLRGAA